MTIGRARGCVNKKSIMSAATVSALAKDLSKAAVDAVEPEAERCIDILSSIDQVKGDINVAILEKTNIGKLLTKSIKSFKRAKRTADDDTKAQFDEAIASAEKLLAALKAAAMEENKKAAAGKKAKATAESQEAGLPKSAGAYKMCLETQKKEIYKNPPALPPASIKIDSKTYPLPKRDSATGELTFTGGSSDIKAMLKDFKPNRTPEEVLRAGSFGGTYFRPIVSAVTNVTYKAADVLKDSVHPDWIKGLTAKQLTSTTYRTEVNKYGVKCGGSLGMWESSGWISDSDPYGWFQWYCRFYQGRRCSDDARQISRWLKSAGPKGRFRSQLCNKILAAKTKHDDVSISPVVRQTLLHWGLEITPQVLEKHRKRVGA